MPASVSSSSRSRCTTPGTCIGPATGLARSYDPPGLWPAGYVPVGSARGYGNGRDLTIITFGNGLRMSLRLAARLATGGIGCRVLDLRWIAPLPAEDILREATVTGRVLVADETRRSGGVSEAIITTLVDAGFTGTITGLTAKTASSPWRRRAGCPAVLETAIESGHAHCCPNNPVRPCLCCSRGDSGIPRDFSRSAVARRGSGTPAGTCRT